MCLEHTHQDFSNENWDHGDPDNAIGRIAVNPLLLPGRFNHPLLDIAHKLYKSPILHPSSAPGASPDEYHILLREQRMYRAALQQAVGRFLDMPTGCSWEATHLIDADVPVTPFGWADEDF
nr:hypothetical protein B0A51_05854 [Rachicladosporium sp. CCFEE 5018]